MVFEYLKKYYIGTTSIVHNDSTVFVSYLWKYSANNRWVKYVWLVPFACNIFRKDVNKLCNSGDFERNWDIVFREKIFNLRNHLSS